MSILILGSEDDEHALHVHHRLTQRGAAAHLVDSRWFPAHLGLALDPQTGQGRIVLPDGTALPYAEIQSVYWRSYHGVWTPPLPDPEQSAIAHNDARGLFESMLIDLPARWVNGWTAFTMHQTKPVQLARVAALGVSIPRTLLTNDADSLRDFAMRNERTIFKPVQGGAHARRLTPAHLAPEALQRLRLAPVTLQEEVPGTNIRVFVAGERVLACEVATEHIDFRDDTDPVIRIHALPADVARHCLAIARACALVWTGIDFRRTPEGRYVFLEANPSPMFLGFERATGLPLTESLVDLLLLP